MVNNAFFGYRGLVNIDLKYKSKTFHISRHNSGTNYLKKVFAKFLSGNYNKETDIPQYIDIEKFNESLNKWETILRSQIPITAKKYALDSSNQEDITWYASFNSVILYSDLLEKINVSDTRSFRLTINTSATKDQQSEILATIEIQAYELSQIVEGSEAIITWIMYLVNAEQ